MPNLASDACRPGNEFGSRISSNGTRYPLALLQFNKQNLELLPTWTWDLISIQNDDGITLETKGQIKTGTFDARPGDALAQDISVLHGAVPKPLLGRTEISFNLNEANQVRLDVYKAGGDIYATLIDNELPAGHHSVPFEWGDLDESTLIYQLRAGDRTGSGYLQVVDH
jgi:hypothetical protein